MKKLYAGILFIALFALSTSAVNAATKITYPNEQSVIYPGQASNMSWEGVDEGVSEYSVYLIGGKLGDSGSRFLGTAKVTDHKSFNFIVPEDIKQGSGYMLQMSGKYVSGGESEKFKIKKDTKKITLETMDSGTIVEGGSNIVKWRGGRGVVQVGVVNGKDTGSILGWIYLKGKPNGQYEWDGKKVCDLTMTVCWNLRGLGGATSYRMIVVSKDPLGNLFLTGNSDVSNEELRLGAAVSNPNESRIQYLRTEINKMQKELDTLLMQ